MNSKIKIGNMVTVTQDSSNLSGIWNGLIGLEIILKKFFF